MLHRVLHYFARWSEIPLIVAAMFVASLWISVWIAIPLGFVLGRALYWPIKLAIAASTIGPDWGRCWGEMIRLDVKKVSFGRNSMGSVVIYYPLAIITMIVGGFIDSEFLLWLGGIVAMWVGTGYLFATMPAAVLFLGRSSPEVNEFLTTLRLRLFPLRATSLLSVGGSSEKVTLRRRLFDYDNVRINNDDEWLEVVTRLARITPVLVIDCRNESDAVSAEIGLLQQPMFANKTFAIVGDDGRADAFDAAMNLGTLVEPIPWRLLSFSLASTDLARICRDPGIVARFQTSLSATGGGN